MGARVNLLLIGCLALGVSACGGSEIDVGTGPDTTGATAGESMRFGEWVEAAADLCIEREKRMDALAEPRDIDELAEFLVEVTSVAEVESVGFEELGIPDADGARVESLLAGLEERLEILEAMEAAARAGDDDEVDRLLVQGEGLSDRLDDLADQLGLDECVSDEVDDSEPAPPVPPIGGDDDTPFSIGDDVELDLLWIRCGEGDPDSCDQLWLEAPVGSRYEEYGFSCGDVVPQGEAQDCTTVLGGGPGASDDPFTYGDDAHLDGLWEDCEDGDPVACDDLYWDSPIGSLYEEFGSSCGFVVPEGEVADCVDVL
jgi:hypothetical protein